MTKRELWEHQENIVNYLSSPDVVQARWGTVVVPTGAGKTNALVAAAAQETRAVTVFATPFISIEDQFLESLQDFGFGVNRSDWVRPREEDDQNTADVAVDYLNNPYSGKRLLTTHAQVVRWGEEIIPAQLKPDWLLVLDEGHHLGSGEGGTKLYAFAAEWHRRGGTVWLATATPFREDDRPLQPPGIDIDPLIISYPDLADKGILPKRLHTCVVELQNDQRGQVLTASDYMHIAALVRQTGRPTLIRIAPGNKEVPAEEAAFKLIDALRAAGYAEDEVLNTVGLEQGTVTSKTLVAERAKLRQGYDNSTLRVIVACGRLGEGADWAPCSHVVMVGVPTSVAKYIQVAGRGSRGKNGPEFTSYRQDWVDDTLITVFVPKFEDIKQEKLDHVSRLFLHACVLAASDVSATYARYWADLVRGFRLPPVAKTRVSPLTLLGNTPPDLAVDASTVGPMLAAGLREVFGRDPLLGEVVLKLAKLKGDGPEYVYALNELVRGAAKDNPRLGKAYRDRLTGVLEELAEKVTASGPIRPVYEDYLKKALEKLVQAESAIAVRLDITIGQSPNRSFKSTLDSKKMRDMGLKLIKTLDLLQDHLRDDKNLFQLVSDYQTAYGTRPSLLTGQQDVSDLVGFPCYLKQIDRLLKQDQPDFGLSELVKAHQLGWHTGKELTLTDLAKVKAKLNANHKMKIKAYAADLNRCFGTTHHPSFLQKVNGRTEHIVALELAARRGWRGLPAGGSLL